MMGHSGNVSLAQPDIQGGCALLSAMFPHTIPASSHFPTPSPTREGGGRGETMLEASICMTKRPHIISLAAMDSDTATCCQQLQHNLRYKIFTTL